jgi:hypothetical protein
MCLYNGRLDLFTELLLSTYEVIDGEFHRFNVS